MTNDISSLGLLTRLRRVLGWLGRTRHYALVPVRARPGPKLTPIATVLADAGRDPASLAD